MAVPTLQVPSVLTFTVSQAPIGKARDNGATSNTSSPSFLAANDTDQIPIE